MRPFRCENAIKAEPERILHRRELGVAMLRMGEPGSKLFSI
jgi:hypothetical protein